MEAVTCEAALSTDSNPEPWATSVAHGDRFWEAWVPYGRQSDGKREHSPSRGPTLGQSIDHVVIGSVACCEGPDGTLTAVNVVFHAGGERRSGA